MLGGAGVSVLRAADNQTSQEPMGRRGCGGRDNACSRALYTAGGANGRNSGPAAPARDRRGNLFHPLVQGPRRGTTWRGAVITSRPARASPGRRPGPSGLRGPRLPSPARGAGAAGGRLRPACRGESGHWPAGRPSRWVRFGAGPGPTTGSRPNLTGSGVRDERAAAGVERPLRDAAGRLTDCARPGATGTVAAARATGDPARRCRPSGWRTSGPGPAHCAPQGRQRRYGPAIRPAAGWPGRRPTAIGGRAGPTPAGERERERERYRRGLRSPPSVPTRRPRPHPHSGLRVVAEGAVRPHGPRPARRGPQRWVGSSSVGGGEEIEGAGRIPPRGLPPGPTPAASGIESAGCPIQRAASCTHSIL
jgi:hypothetical protein